MKSANKEKFPCPLTRHFRGVAHRCKSVPGTCNLRVCHTAAGQGSEQHSGHVDSAGQRLFPLVIARQIKLQRTIFGISMKRINEFKFGANFWKNENGAEIFLKKVGCRWKLCRNIIFTSDTIVERNKDLSKKWFWQVTVLPSSGGRMHRLMLA